MTAAPQPPAVPDQSASPSVDARRRSLSIAGPFAHDRYFFSTGLRAGQVAAIRGASQEVLLTYRSFASIAGVVATFVAALMLVAGAAAVLLLWTQGSPVRAVIALTLTAIFAFVILLLVPKIDVTLFDNDQPALLLRQQAKLFGTRFTVATPNGATLAEIRHSALCRLGRHRWTIWQDGRYLGEAVEESFFGALLRKFLGKFSRTFETNVTLRVGGLPTGRIPRRSADVLEVTSDALDRRVAVALATLILGNEP